MLKSPKITPLIPLAAAMAALCLPPEPSGAQAPTSPRAPAQAPAQAVAQAQAVGRPVISLLRATGPTSFLLRWEAPPHPEASEGGPQVLGFRVYRDGKRVAQLGAAEREWRDAGLKPSTVYSYAVAAVGAGGEEASPTLTDITGLPSEGGREARAEFEAVVVGATPGGIASALALARLGHRVALVSPSPWIGGMMTGGLSRTDFGSMKSAGGAFKEFVDRVAAYYTRTYGADSPQARASRGGYYFEPRVAKWVFHQMLAEQPGVTLLLDHHPRGVEKQGARATALYVLDRPRMVRKVLAARVFIDATYEGDLAAQAGARYRVGRESRAEFGEEHAGELFWEPTRRQVILGSGRGDRRVQAYNFRLCLSRDAANRWPFPAPTSYDRSRYTPLLQAIASGRAKSMEQVLSILPLPGGKWDANNHPLGNPSSDLIGGADAWPESDIWAREGIAEAHRQHILGLMHFVQDDAEVPAAFREEARRWGLASDEFVDNGRWPTQLYVREARRIVGAGIFTENDARSGDPQRRPNFHPDSVAVADYPIDSHATSWERGGLLEGFFYLPGSATQPSQVPFGIMTPSGVEGVLVSVCVSCTHIGYGTLRMEPVFLSLGTAAGVAAHLALEDGVAPSQVDRAALQRALLDQKQVLAVFHDVPLDHPNWAALQFFGVRGFFPTYQARPEAPLTQGEGAAWLWLWMQQHRPGLQAAPARTLEAKALEAKAAPGDEAAAAAAVDEAATQVLALESLVSLGVVARGQEVRAEAPLPAPLAQDWIEGAWRMLRGLPDAPRLSPVRVQGAQAMARGEMCQKLYDIEPRLGQGVGHSGGGAREQSPEPEEG